MESWEMDGLQSLFREKDVMPNKGIIPDKVVGGEGGKIMFCHFEQSWRFSSQG